MEIMIIDDDDDDLHLYSELFENIDNAHTHVFNDAARALDYLQHTSPLPDLIILDFNMPRMNGVEFLRLLRADRRLKHLRATVVTTSCSGRDREALKELDVACHQKPSSFGDFKALLKRLTVNS